MTEASSSARLADSDDVMATQLAPMLDSRGNPPAAHVPPELIRSIDWFGSPEIERDPYAHLNGVFREQPSVFYNMFSPLKGQSWFVTTAALARQVLGDGELFTSLNITGFAESIGEDWLLGAVEMAEPQHTRIRELMLQWLNPVAVSKLKAHVDQRAADIVDRLLAQGSCEFIEEFAVSYPVDIILEMMGLPLEDKPSLLKWMHMMTHGQTPDERREGAVVATQYFKDVIADRQASARDDLITRIVQSKIDGEPITSKEILGIVMVLFLGGLDTVVATLSHHFHHLATDQELQAHLRANPQDHLKAIHELLRYYPPATSHRMATRDTELDGVKIRKGDWIVVVHGVVNHDLAAFADADRVDINRPDNRHFTFSFEPHFCIGMHLAMRELIAGYREWLSRVPPFRLAEPEKVKKFGGLTYGIHEMRLIWD
jgi:cytochrome P450